jgi:hypothetical protein
MARLWCKLPRKGRLIEVAAVEESSNHASACNHKNTRFGSPETWEGSVRSCSGGKMVSKEDSVKMLKKSLGAC